MNIIVKIILLLLVGGVGLFFIGMAISLFTEWKRLMIFGFDLIGVALVTLFSYTMYEIWRM